MPLPREHYPKQIADRLHELAGKLKTRSRASLTDANHSLETVMQRFFNALYGWKLVNLNAAQDNFPSADLGDREGRIAIQITNENAGKKITETAATARDHGLGADYDRLIIFFLLVKKPGLPKTFVQPDGGPLIECEDITTLLKQMLTMEDLTALKKAAAVLEDEMTGTITPGPLLHYFKALSDNFSTYENLGLPPPANAEGEKDVRIAIRELFVEPACTPGRVSPEEFDAALLAGKNPAEPLLPVLAGEERRIVLLADPGMGKSTLIQWLISTLAEEATLPTGTAGLRGAIPLPFILRDLVGHLPKDAAEWDWPALLKAFANYHPRAADRPPLAAALTGDETSFRTLLASDRAFFLIDGLDEIGDPAHRRALRDALWQGFKQYPNARWLVTSRWVGYEEAEVHAEKEEFGYYDQDFFRTTRIKETVRSRLLYLAPFDDTRQLTFARHWYLPRMGPVLGAEHAGKFVEAVRRHPAVRVIGRVPNLLYLLALLYRHRALLPHGRTHVYTAISEAYLGGIDLGIDAARGSIDAAKRLHGGSEHKDKVRLLATIARQMQERRAAKKEREDAGDILVTRAELEQWLAPHFPGDGGCAALHAFISYVAARSGLLLPRGEGQFGFAHLSFQEYYAACWLEEEFRLLLNAQAETSSGEGMEDDDMPERATLTREQFPKLAALTAWREPLVFLVEKLSTNAADTRTVIRWLFPQLSHPDPVPEHGKRPPLLMPIEAARLLAALSLDPQVALAGKARQTIWQKLWPAHLTQQGIWDWHLAPVLLATSEFQQEVWDILIPLQPQKLDLRGCTGVADLAPLAALAQLPYLNLSGCTGVADLTPLADLTQLEMLHINECPGVADLAPLAGLTQLQELAVEGCTGVMDLVPLAGLAQLQALYLSGCTGVVDLAPLACLTHLQTLDLNDCTGVTDIAPLAGLTQLQVLLLGSTGVADLAPLDGLAQLQELYLADCAGLSAEAVAAFIQSHPKTVVYGQ